MISRESRKGFVLTGDCPGPPEDAPRVSVIIPAKDEAGNIETCLRGWLEQDYPNFQVIVCNDRSSDETGPIAERIAAEDDRVQVIHVDELPDRWCGKNHAVFKAASAADGEWICMTDADCHQTSNRTLSVAVQYALDHQVEMLSMLPLLKMVGFWENLVQPVCSGMLMIWFHPDRVNDPARAEAYANGAFILIKRTAYEAIGTHEAIRDVVMEDMELASRAKQAGISLRVIRNSGLYLVRMYTSLAEIIQGWSRIFLGSFGTMRRLRVSFLVLLIMGFMPYTAAALGLSMAARAAEHAPWWWACGAVGLFGVTMQISVLYRFFKLMGARAGLAWTYLLACVIAMISVVTAMSKLRPGATVVWKGTAYDGRRRG